MMTESTRSLREPVPMRADGRGPQSVAMLCVSALVVFGAVLTGYALLRVGDPAAFTWAPTLLDRKLGWSNASSLIVACAAALAACTAARRACGRAARRLLLVALVAGTGSLAIHLCEIPSHTRLAGLAPKHSDKPVTVKTVSTPVAGSAHTGDGAAGKRIFLGTCAACHAPDGSGVKGQGQNLRDSVFLKDKTDDQALAFVKRGRQPFDPDSKLHLAMPARGGNPSLTDANLLDAIAYVREIQKNASTPGAAPSANLAKPKDQPPAQGASSDQPQIIDGELWLPHSVLPPSQSGPQGSDRAAVARQKVGAAGHDAANVERFFSIVVFADGLLAIYLGFGVLLGVWFLTATRNAPLSVRSFDAAAAYWLVIGTIGLLLFPAFSV